MIVLIFEAILVYLLLVWAAIVNTLWLNPRVLELVEQNPQSAWVVGGIVFLAGASTLLGESAILFINRVRKGRFFLSLITNGLVFMISYAVWGLTISIVGRIIFQVNPPWGQVVRMVGLSTAPLVFGFLVLIPWMGTFISKVLNIWSVLILIGIVQFEFKIGFGGAVMCVVFGWVLSLLFTNTIGGPVVKLRNKVFQKVSGSSLEQTNEDILLRFAGATFEELETQLEEEVVELARGVRG
jgi:hypothetical protein